MKDAFDDWVMEYNGPDQEYDPKFYSEIVQCLGSNDDHIAYPS